MASYFLPLLSLLLLALCVSAEQQLNIYGQQLEMCDGPTSNTAGSGAGGRCTFRSYDRGAHQVCVKSMPDGFSSKTGQGPWSDEYIDQSWCICIWAYASYVTNHPDQPLPIKCSAISSSVMDSDFAISHFRSGASSYRTAVEKMCNTCSQQAPDTAAREHLERQCGLM